ncbi:MAG: amidophosphoribosyltransferase [Nitrososphaerales archaeon]
MKEKCGLFAAYSQKEVDVVPHVVMGLRALQHRGQEAWGLAIPNAKPFKRRGLVTDNLEESLPAVDRMPSKLAIGHVRYSTVGGTSLKLAQPLHIDRKFSIAHNGTICELDSLTKKVNEDFTLPTNCGDTMAAGYRLLQLLQAYKWDWYRSIESLAKELIGAYCFLVIDNEGKIFAFRDPKGFRPLCIGWHQRSKSYLIASESCAFEVMGAELVRDVSPGEIVCLSRSGMDTKTFQRRERSAHCAFEYTYFAHPSSVIDGISVYESRKRLGMKLADLYKDVKGDIIIPVPDSARPAAMGFSERSGIPLAEGLMKDRYGRRGGLRSFIQPRVKDRVEINHWVLPVRVAVEGKNVIVIDDSIVRGTSSKTIIKTLRDAGAKSVKMFVTFPPVTSPCKAGIDFPTHKELIAYRTSGKHADIKKVNELVGREIGADSFGYNDVKSLSEGIGLDEKRLCLSCHTGDYSVLGIS